MARLTLVYHPDEKSYANIGRRQRPMVVDDKLTMLMDLNSKGLCIDCPQLRGRDLEIFTRKFNLLTPEELRKALEIDSTEVFSVLNQCVQCVGCRRQVERIFNQLTISEHPTLDPILIKSNCTLSINEDKLKTPQTLGTVLYRHHEVLNNLLESKLRNKTRCALHSLDAFRTKPFSETWREVWSLMTPSCRDELAVIQTKMLQKVLDGYLKKHKFCTDCRGKIEKAYKILIGENTSKEKGYVPALFANIKKCYYDQHIHIVTNKIDFLDALIRRAEPEVNGSYSKLRERHAKTLEIAQEEVLTCVGIIINERLRRVYVTLREEERACQVLAAVGVHALCRSFDTFVEKKQGISNLELLYQEMSRAEKAKEYRREQKKLKKKKKKIEKKMQQCSGAETCEHAPPCGEEDEEEAAVDGDGESDVCCEDDDDHDEAVELTEPNDEDEYEYDGEEEHSNCAAHTTHRAFTKSTSTSTTTDEHETSSSLNDNQINQKQQPKKNERKKKQKQKQKQKQKPPAQKKINGKQVAQKMVAVHVDKVFGGNQFINAHDNLDMSAVSEKCEECLEPAAVCPCENDVKDSGYGSEPNLSHSNSRMSSVVPTPEGSEVSCSDGFCNHHHDGANDMDMEEHHRHQITTDCLNGTCESFMCREKCLNATLTLEQMLEDYEYAASDDENCYIPQEVLLEYQCHYERVQQQRQQLRQQLRQNFERLCLQQRGYSTSPLTIIKQ